MIEKITEQYSLKDISKRYSRVLLDASVLRKHPFAVCLGSDDLARKLDVLDAQRNSAGLLRRYILELENLYITEMVLKDFWAPRARKTRLSLIESSGEEEFLNLARKLKEVSEAKKDLFATLSDPKRIIELNTMQECDYKIYHDANAELIDPNKLRDVDYDLLIKGFVLGRKVGRETTAILSNHFGMGKSWSSLRRRYYLSPSQFGFFKRNDLDRYSSFEQM
jgi:hypothetical protein